MYAWKWCTGSALWLLHGWCHVKYCHFGACSVYTIQPCTRLQCHFIQSHIVYACLAVTCHLHFWQDDRDLLRATAVTRGWNGYRNKSQHRKLTLEKKTLPPLLPGFEPATFRSRVRRSTTELSRSPLYATVVRTRECVCVREATGVTAVLTVIRLSVAGRVYH